MYNYYVNLQCKSATDGEFVLAEHIDVISRLFAGNTVEQIMEELEADGSEWALKQLSIMKKMVKNSF